MLSPNSCFNASVRPCVQITAPLSFGASFQPFGARGARQVVAEGYPWVLSHMASESEHSTKQCAGKQRQLKHQRSKAMRLDLDATAPSARVADIKAGRKTMFKSSPSLHRYRFKHHESKQRALDSTAVTALKAHPNSACACRHSSYNEGM